MRFMFSTLFIPSLFIPCLALTLVTAATAEVSPRSGKTGIEVTVHGIQDSTQDPLIVFFADDHSGALTSSTQRSGDRVSGILGPARRNNTSVEVWLGKSLHLPEQAIVGVDHVYSVHDATLFLGSEREPTMGHFFVEQSSPLTFSGGLDSEGRIFLDLTGFPPVDSDPIDSIRVDVIIDGQGITNAGSDPPPVNPKILLSSGTFIANILATPWHDSPNGLTTEKLATDLSTLINQVFGGGTGGGYVSQTQGSGIFVTPKDGIATRGFIQLQINPDQP